MVRIVGARGVDPNHALAVGAGNGGEGLITIKLLANLVTLLDLHFGGALLTGPDLADPPLLLIALLQYFHLHISSFLKTSTSTPASDILRATFDLEV
jgi:hypothetical protein